ncbi:MAG: DEAD/DEAH box helicase [Opitutales bacterium]|nr:DEAD/DEAH box helicase [Opitutales bacterium]NRA27975.1 DEAD/DEAH box helicase [Opitutales bacterium]
MATSDRQPPAFDKNFLVDLGGWSAFREGKALFEGGAVKHVEWEAPSLHGEVRVGGKSFFPRLNLRSVSFPDARCSCLKGQRGQVCEHLMALCMHYEAHKHDARQEVKPIEPAEPDETAVPSARRAKSSKKSGLKSLFISQAQGEALSLKVFLPPNLEQAAEKDSIVVKIEAHIGDEKGPLEGLDKTKPYKVASHDYLALALLEEWSRGKPSSIVQLSRERLRFLLDNYVDVPAIYFLNQPEQPLEWDDLELPDVYPFLDEDAIEDDDDDDVPVYSAFGGSRRRSSNPPTPRSTGPSFFKQKDSGGSVDSGELEVDGSPNFLAIKLPGRSHPNHNTGLDLLKAEGFRNEPSNGKWWLRDSHKVLNFLANFWDRLEGEWGARFSANFKKQMKGVKRAEITSDIIEVRNGFSINLALSAGKADDAEVRQSLSVGKNYVQSGKSVFLINPSKVEKLQAAQKALSGDIRSELSPSFQHAVNAAGLADAEKILSPMVRDWRPPESWQERSGALNEVSQLKPPPVKQALEDTLRGYQRIGVAWLYHLYNNELGGILADEMGLGKTLQALSLIQCVSHADSDPGPSLVVCPASVVENWIREGAKFTPELKSLAHHGSQRIKDPNELKTYDLIVTSYGTMARDVEIFSAVDFKLIIGDEAQHIKNRKTQNARSLRALISRGRFLLTGTPIENSLDDLRALFDFLMPGYLADRPTGLDAEGRAWYDQRHREQGAPYILRRSKKMVAPELPDKIEQVFYCHMEGAQAQLYEKILKDTQDTIFKLEMDGANEGSVKMAAFNQLLRLRQVCADPRILDPNMAAATSSKLQAFREILDEALQDGHRILLFSQFVSVLKLLRSELEDQGLKFCYLDGSTRNRQRLVDEFNDNDDIPVFLISLKAGGTGLNLTGADTVVHYDPWWNPAIEAQATDRAHRIGQKRVVTSIKLIASETVEEQVVDLQKSKAKMLEELLEASEAANAKVSLKDIKDLLGM